MPGCCAVSLQWRDQLPYWRMHCLVAVGLRNGHVGICRISPNSNNIILNIQLPELDEDSTYVNFAIFDESQKQVCISNKKRI